MIKYQDGYKYQLYEDYVHYFPSDFPTLPLFENDYCLCLGNAKLVIFKGYAWDGPSGPTIDTNTFMRGSLVHDCLYELMRERRIPRTMKEVADKELKRICLEDGMSSLRAWWVYKGVSMFGKQSTIQEKDIKVAP